MARAIFWTSFILIFYVYLGYPILLAMARGLRRRTVRKTRCEPSVSLVIAAHNERECIDAKLRNCLALDYPPEKLQIIVSVDGSTDGTAEAARCYQSERVIVIESTEHQGKAAALNRGVAVSRGEIILFADARQQVSPDAVREIVADLEDPAVGAVSGELILRDRLTGGEARDAVGIYWRYEKWIRSLESEANSVVGATGALYAIRRELFSPIPLGTILDDVWLPMRIALRGKRVVFEPRARAYDNVACCSEMEFVRKVRTLVGNYQLLLDEPALLVPWRNPIFIQFVSHKVGRLLVPYFLAALFFSNCFLLHGTYLIFLAAQVTWYLLALGGMLATRGTIVEAPVNSYAMGGSQGSVQ